MDMTLECMDGGVRDGKAFLFFSFCCLELCNGDHGHQPRISFKCLVLHLNSH